MYSSHALDLTHNDESLKAYWTRRYRQRIWTTDVTSKMVWSATTEFARDVIVELRKEEKKRRELQMRNAGHQAME